MGETQRASEPRDDRPLAGTLVVDASRMLPGAVLARMLLDLGARVVKVEAPGTGDPMRGTPPLVHGMGAGFATFYAGAESVCFKLSDPDNAASFRRLAARADVLVESFRPGKLASWGLAPETLRAANPRLVICSLTAMGSREAVRDEVGHDLNLQAISGILTRVREEGVPKAQLADVPAAQLACSAILAALLRRERTGAGAHLEQPLLTGPLPLLAWAWTEHALGKGGQVDAALGGALPCYRVYTCAGGERVALAVLEPKFWIAFLDMLGLGHLMMAGADAGPAGRKAAEAIEERLRTESRVHWVQLARQRGVPLSPVHDLDEARESGVFEDAGLLEDLPLPDGSSVRAIGPFLPSLGRMAQRPAPRLGQHTRAVLAELEDGGEEAGKPRA